MKADTRPRISSEGPDDLAEDLEAEFGADGLVGLVTGLEVELFSLLIVGQEFHGEVVIDDGDDDIAGLGRCAFLDHHDVAFKQTGIFHGIAANLEQDGLGGDGHQVFVDRQCLEGIAEGRMGGAGADGIDHLTLEEALGWRQAACWTGFEVATLFEAFGESGDGGGGLEAEQFAYLGEGRQTRWVA